MDAINHISLLISSCGLQVGQLLCNNLLGSLLSTTQRISSRAGMLSPSLMFLQQKHTAIDVHARPRLDTIGNCPCAFTFPLDAFTDGIIHSMTCEKQFVPRDEKAIYCSEG